MVFSTEEANEWSERGEAVILVRTETSPEDIQGMIVARGILTARGGMTSHAAVVARGWGKCCVAGCDAIAIDYQRGQFSVQVDGQGEVVVRRGDIVSLDGSSGEVMLDSVPLVAPVLPDEYERLMAGPTPNGGWGCGPTRTRRRTRRGPASLGLRGSGCAAPSTCSLGRTASWRCGR